MSRQIFLSMAAVTVTAALVVFASIFVGWALIVTFFPRLADTTSLLPSETDLSALAGATLVALLVAGWIALRLAGRILDPLNSLALSARRIAAGDLTARAVPGDRSLGETAHLVTDFNRMAERLQGMASDMSAWNAAVAHELRTPLTILRGKLQGVVDGVFRADEDLIRALLLQIDGLSRLVDDLRLVTLADSGHLDLQKRSIDLAAEIETVVDLLRPSLAAAGFAVDVTMVDVDVVADGARIRQALLALLENALRHAEPGRIEIVTLMSEGWVVIRVSDEGPGLHEDFAKRAFEPFARGGRARSRPRDGGSGLGLSVVRAIAEAHGGAAVYRSSSRGGSAFEIHLPRGVD